MAVPVRVAEADAVFLGGLRGPRGPRGSAARCCWQFTRGGLILAGAACANYGTWGLGMSSLSCGYKGTRHSTARYATTGFQHPVLLNSFQIPTVCNG